MPSQRLLAGLVAVLAAALVLLSALFLSRERDHATPSASLPPARTAIAEVEPGASEPLQVIAPEDGEELARTDRIELLPFEVDRPDTVAAPPLSDPAEAWEKERDARRALASRSIALLLRDGTTPTASVPAGAASRAGGGGRVLIARAPAALETPYVPWETFGPGGSGGWAPGRSGWMPGRPSKFGPAPVPRRVAPAGRSGGSARCGCP